MSESAVSCFFVVGPSHLRRHRPLLDLAPFGTIDLQRYSSPPDVPARRCVFCEERVEGRQYGHLRGLSIESPPPLPSAGALDGARVPILALPLDADAS